MNFKIDNNPKELNKYTQHLVKHPHRKEFNEMNKEEYRNFFDMDFIERMIRVEQRISARFGRFVTYKETEYFKSLSREKQKKFEKYLKMKTIKKAGLVFILAISLAIFIGALQFTGRAVTQEGNLNYLNVSLIAAGVVLGLIAYFILYGGNKSTRDRVFKEGVQSLDNVLNAYKHKRHKRHKYSEKHK